MSLTIISNTINSLGSSLTIQTDNTPLLTFLSGIVGINSIGSGGLNVNGSFTAGTIQMNQLDVITASMSAITLPNFIINSTINTSTPLVVNSLNVINDSPVIQVGDIINWAGTPANIPAGYLICSGQNISRTTYPELFSIMSTTYSQNEYGSSSGMFFGLPNFSTDGDLPVWEGNALMSGMVAFVPNLPVSVHHSIPYYYGSTIYITGGITNTDTATTYAFTLGTNSWTQSTAFPGTIGYAGSTFDASRLYVVGGRFAGTLDSRVYLADITTGLSFTRISSYPLPIIFNNAVCLYNTGLYVFGGSTSGSTNTNAAYVLNTNSPNGSWEQIASLPYTVQSNKAFVYKNRAYLVGGVSGASTINSCLSYDFTTNSYTVLPAYPSNISGYSGFVHRNYLVIYGSGTGTYALDLENTSGGWKRYISNYPLSVDSINTLKWGNYIISMGGWTGASSVANSYTMKIESPEKTIKLIKYTNSAFVDNQTPIGTILPYTGPNIPTNYLECNGQLLNRQSYLELFNVMSTSIAAENDRYGSGIITSSLFALPGYQTDIDTYKLEVNGFQSGLDARLPDLPQPLYEGVAGYTGNKIFYFGGFTAGAGAVNTTMYIFDVNSSVSWTNIVCPGYPSTAIRTTPYVQNDSLLVFAGGSYLSSRTSSCYVLNLSTLSMTQITSYPTFIIQINKFAINNGRIYSVEGNAFTGSDVFNRQIYSIGINNILTDSWTLVNSAVPKALSYHNVHSWRDNLIISGGYNNTDGVQNTLTYVYNIPTNTYSTLSVGRPQGSLGIIELYKNYLVSFEPENFGPLNANYILDLTNTSAGWRRSQMPYAPGNSAFSGIPSIIFRDYMIIFPVFKTPNISRIMTLKLSDIVRERHIICAKSGANVPIGSLITSASNRPRGYLSLDENRILNRGQYLDLYSEIGTRYGGEYDGRLAGGYFVGSATNYSNTITITPITADLISNRWIGGGTVAGMDAFIPNLPVATSAPAVFSNNSAIYLTTGLLSNNSTTSNTYVYTIGAASWTQITGLTYPFAVSDAVYTQNQSRVFVIGGNRGSTVIDSRVYVADLSNSWTQIATYPKAIYRNGACIYDSGLYVFGGVNSSTVLSETYVFNMNNLSDSWTQLRSLPTALYAIEPVVYKNRAYIVGGHNGSNSINTFRYYDFDTNSFTTITPSYPTNISLYDVILYKNILTVCGGTISAGVFTNDCYSINLDNTTGGWFRLFPKLPMNHLITSPKLVWNNYVVSLGGYSGSTSVANVYVAKLDDSTRLPKYMKIASNDSPYGVSLGYTAGNTVRNTGAIAVGRTTVVSDNIALQIGGNSQVNGTFDITGYITANFDNSIQTYNVASTLTNIDISGLNMESYGGEMRIKINVRNPTAGTTNYQLFINGDTTTTNYYSVNQVDATTTSQNTSLIGTAIAGGNYTFDIYLTIDSSRKHLARIGAIGGVFPYASGNIQMNHTLIYHNAYDNVSSLRISSSVSGGIAAGSQIKLFYNV
jgi:N-acetylneuraminic acid mutarotase